MCVCVYIYIYILIVYVVFGIFVLTNEFILLYFIINIFLIYFILWYQGHCCGEGTNIVLRPGMKCYPSQFARLPYYEDLKISHLFDTMHVGKNVTEMLWRTIDVLEMLSLMAKELETKENYSGRIILGIVSVSLCICGLTLCGEYLL